MQSSRRLMTFARNLRGSLTTSLRNLFVPNDANGGTPQVLSGIGISAYLLIALFLLFAPQLVRVRQLASLTEPFGFTGSQMIALTNQARTAEGLSVLATNATLTAAAEAKVSDMFAKQYFAHTSPEGVTPWDFFKSSGYAYRAAGENLASDFVRPEDAEAAFMASPTHRANIMSPLYTEVGIAVGQGLLGGHANIVIAEYFGTPKTAAATVKVTPNPTPKPTPKPAPKPATTTTVATKPAPVTVTSSIGIRTTTTSVAATTPSTPEVLGTAVGTTAGTAPSQNVFSTFRKAVSQFARRIPEYMKMKVLALILMASLAIAIAFFIARAEHLAPHVLVRAFVVLVMLGYAGTIGIKDWQSQHLTPTSFATISVVEVQ